MSAIHQAITGYGASIHPDAAAYAATTGLTGTTLTRLSNFLKNLDQVAITPVQMILGRSEFLARSGATYRAVYGGNGTVVGTVTDGATGMGFNGANGNRVDFVNPLANPVSEFSIWASASASGAQTAQLVGSFFGTTTRGPSLGLGGAISAGGGLSYSSGGQMSSDGIALLTRSQATYGLLVGKKRIYAMNFSGSYVSGDTDTRPFTVFRDVDLSAPSASAFTSAWNGNANWSIGQRSDNGSKLNTGEIDFVMLTDHCLTKEQRIAFLKAGAENQIWDVPDERIVIAVGDSMTQGTSGGSSSINSRTPQLTFHQASGWQGGYYTEAQQSGQGIDVQETLYAGITYIFDALSSFDRYVMFWGGYNSTAPISAVEATRNALVDRYIAMGLDAKARGVQSIHWSYLIGDGDEGYSANTDAFNDYYAAQCALHGFIWYDHRITFSSSEFDGSAADPTYVSGDGRHLTQLGQEVLVADFIAAFPNPVPLP